LFPAAIAAVWLLKEKTIHAPNKSCRYPKKTRETSRMILQARHLDINSKVLDIASKNILNFHTWLS
jgi:hypothetical protein